MKLKRSTNLFKELVGEGEEIPRFYGVAYIETPGFNAVAYPLPLNYLARWIRSLYHALLIPKPSWWEERFMHVRSAAFSHGVEAGKLTKIDGISLFSKSQMSRIHAQAYEQGKTDLLHTIERDLDERKQRAELCNCGFNQFKDADAHFTECPYRIKMENEDGSQSNDS